jgi:hypothetical protein
MMAPQPDISIVLPLSHIDELFTAPSINPFSTHEVDIFGQSAFDYVKKRVARLWPRRPHAVNVTLQLPADQITPELTKQTRDAVERYCTDRISSNQLQRGLVIQRSQRQMIGALIGTLVSLAVIALLAVNPFGLIPDFLRGLLTVFAAFAIAILIFNSVWSLVFDWVPFVQDNTVHTVLMGMDLLIEPQRGDERA